MPTQPTTRKEKAPTIVQVGVRDDFAHGTVSLRELGGRTIGIACWNGELYAFHNRCPHQGGPICAGHLGPRMEGPRTGAMEIEAGRPVISCPWHSWEFDLTTGKAFWDERYGIRMYPVTINEQAEVFVQLSGPRQNAPRGEKEA